MAYNADGLQVFADNSTIGTGSGSIVRGFFYATNDAASVVEASGYFNALADDLNKGDVILATMDRDGTAVAKHYVVTATTATTVTVGLFTTTAG